jgi:hypothetical protein
VKPKNLPSLNSLQGYGQTITSKVSPRTETTPNTATTHGDGATGLGSHWDGYIVASKEAENTYS